MILDKMVFSDAQAVVSSTTDNSTNTLDTEVAGSNIGGGTPIWLVCRVNTKMSGNVGTFTVALQNCATSGGTFQTIASSKAHSNGELVKGFDLLTIPLPVDNLRYLRILYTSSTSGFEDGKIDALLTLNAPRN